MSAVATVKIQVDGKEAAQKLKELVGLSGQLETKTQSGSQSFNAFGKAAGIFAAKLFTVKAAVDVVKKGIEVAFERGATEQRLKNLTGSTDEFRAAMGAAAKISNDFGISQNQAARELTDLYARLQGAGFGLKEITTIYRGFEAIAKTTGTTNEVASRTFLQLEQALSRGSLQGQDFLAVASNMPGVLDAIAAEAGVTRGELRAMSSQGEITGDLIYRALSRANAGFDGIESRLNKQQKAFNDLSTVVERLNTVIGNVFGPILVTAIEAVAAVSQKLADWWEYLYKNVLPRVIDAFKPLTDVLLEAWAGFPADEILAWVQGGLLRVIDNVIAALKFVIPIVAAIVEKFNEIVTSNAFNVVLFALEKVAPLLGISNTEVRDFHEGEKLAAEEAAKLVDNFSSLPEVAGQANQEINQMEQSLSRSVQELENQSIAIQGQIQRLSTVGSIVGARLGAEKALNDLQGTRLQRQYEEATTAQRRYDIAVAMFRNQVDAARIEYQQALANIKLEESKVQLQLSQEIIKGKQIVAEGRLQLLKAGSVEEEQKIIDKLKGALDAQNSVIRATNEQVAAQKVIGQYQETSAQAQYKNKVETAATALQQKLVSDEIGLSATRASSMAGNLATGATNSATMARMGQDLQQKLDAASKSVEAGVRANQGAVQQFSVGAVEATKRQDEWRDSVINGSKAQDGLKGKIEEVGKTHMQVYQEKYKVSEETYRKMAQSNRDDFIGPIQRQTFDLGTFIIGVINKVTEAMGLSFTSAFSGIRNIVGAITASVVNAINIVVNAINVLIRGANAALARVGSGARLPQLPTLSVPAFAQGGVVNKPTLALIGEGGEKEYIVPQSKVQSFALNQLRSTSLKQSAARLNQAGMSQAAIENLIRQLASNIDLTKNFSVLEERVAAESKKVLQKFAYENLGRSAAPRLPQTFANQNLRTNLEPRSSNNVQAAPTSFEYRQEASVRIDNGPVTISIRTGPVMQFDGKKYVTFEDMERAMRATADAVIGRLRTPAARTALGRS